MAENTIPNSHSEVTDMIIDDAEPLTDKMIGEMSTSFSYFDELGNDLKEILKESSETFKDLNDMLSSNKEERAALTLKIEKLQTESSSLRNGLKTATEDFKSEDSTFSDSYGLLKKIKDILKLYEENEQCLKAKVLSLTNVSEECIQLTIYIMKKVGEFKDECILNENLKFTDVGKGVYDLLAPLQPKVINLHVALSTLKNDVNRMKKESKNRKENQSKEKEMTTVSQNVEKLSLNTLPCPKQ